MKTLALSLLLAAAPPRFDFAAIEFAPAAERLPAAQAFLAVEAAPGTPLPAAVAAIERAHAACARRPARDGAIVCRASRPSSHSALDMPMGDVTWTVRLLPAPGGTVAAATVDREDTAG